MSMFGSCACQLHPSSFTFRLGVIRSASALTGTRLIFCTKTLLSGDGDAPLVVPAVARRQMNTRLKLSAVF